MMSNTGLFIITIIACAISRFLFFCIFSKFELKFLIFWACVCIAYYHFLHLAWIYAVMAYIFVVGFTSEDSSQKSSSSTSTRARDKSTSDYKIYEDGTRRVSNLSKTGHYYSNGSESWAGMLGEEHRSNGEVVYDNAYISGRRDIYNKNGEYIGYEYEDSLGITHRVDK